jgi:glycosyltransferase involved in cell wall biosynthesis
MKIALVTDWIYGGGSERVVEEIHKLYPDAPIYTSYCSNEWRKRLDNKVVTGYLQHPPFRQLRKFLPLLRQWWFKGLNLSEFDLIISVTGNGEAKFARTKNGKHISYCNTPVHFYWRHYDEYLKNPGFRPQWLARLGLKLLVRPLRKRDFKAAQKVDYLIANSTHIKNDIKKFYGRDSEVIFPPVDVDRFMEAKQPDKRVGFVTMGRQVPLKRTDIIIEACKQLNVPLTVLGNGPEHSRLVGITGPSIHFKTDVTDKDMPGELAQAEAFIFASFEDFGVAPVESMATGTPVIAYKAGGAIDYIVPGKTGEFFAKQSVDSLVEALESFNSHNYSHNAISLSSKLFSQSRFKNDFNKLVVKNTK